MIFVVLDGVGACANNSNVEVTFCSDNCYGQLNNTFIIYVYLYVVTNFPIHSVTHKYIAVGHKLNDGDSYYCLVEKYFKISL
jgi:hypothetical protein